VPAGLVNDVGEALDFAERLGLAPVVDLDGVRSVANPIGIDAAPTRYASPPPRLDEHHGADWHPNDSAGRVARSAYRDPHPATEGTAR
jgi:hypothetical protein